MGGVNLGRLLAFGLPSAAAHFLAVALARALREYSRTRLEEVCEALGRPDRADAIVRDDDAAERAAEGLAGLSGLTLAALLGAAIGEAEGSPRVEGSPRAEVSALLALLLAGLGHVAAGVAGRVHAESILAHLWPAAEFIRRAMTPLTAASRGIEALAYRLARRTRPTPRPASVEVEIEREAGSDPGDDIDAGLPESAREILANVVELTRRDVAEAMIPRGSILALPARTPADAAAKAFVDSGHSRIPLFGENRDDIVGILYAKDLFARITRGEPPVAIAIRTLARPPLYVPESKNAYEMLDEFRSRRVQMAIVLDEYGGVAGLVTLEDLLEELVGPIDDEHDIPTGGDLVFPLGGTRYEVLASLDLESLNDRLDLDLPTDGDFQTVGGLALDALGRIPDPGATFRSRGVEFTVLEVAHHAIRKLMLDTKPADGGAGG